MGQRVFKGIVTFENMMPFTCRSPGGKDKFPFCSSFSMPPRDRLPLRNSYTCWVCRLFLVFFVNFAPLCVPVYSDRRNLATKCVSFSPFRIFMKSWNNLRPFPRSQICVLRCKTTLFNTGQEGAILPHKNKRKRLLSQHEAPNNFKPDGINRIFSASKVSTIQRTSLEACTRPL